MILDIKFSRGSRIKNPVGKINIIWIYRMVHAIGPQIDFIKDLALRISAEVCEVISL